MPTSSRVQRVSGLEALVINPMLTSSCPLLGAGVA